MINNKIKLDDYGKSIDDAIKDYLEKSKSASKSILQYEEKLKNQLLKKETEERLRAEKKIVKEVTALRAQNIIESDAKAAEQLQKLKQKYEDELAAQKLEAEINNLKQISAYSSRERQKDLQILELQRNLYRQEEALEAKKLAVVAAKQAVESNPDDKAAKDALKDARRELKNAKSDRNKTAIDIKNANVSGKIESNVRSRQENFRQNGGAVDQMVATLKEQLAFQRTAEGKSEIWQENLTSTLKGVGASLKESLSAINSAISSYAGYQTAINTRLQGTTSTFATITKQLSEVAFSPLVNAEDLYANVSSLAQEGIVTNLAQRAFFQTIKEGIADTFDVNESYLKRIIRVQQTDSTAARLGMEGYLTRFLNAFVENTEYLTTTFDTVAESLLEASALMSTDDSTEFEYTVQKWLGILTGVGLAEGTATSIAEAIGKLGSGDVDFFSEGVGTLLTLSANKAGLDISSAINNGLTSEDTNELLKTMVEYLQDIATSTSSNVVKSQLAKTFGVSISDIQAVTNLTAGEVAEAYNSILSYTDMYAELADQMNQVSERMGTANILENLFSNMQYQTGMNIASSPALYALWKVTDMIQSVTGGINIPAISVMGSGIDLETTVENLLKIGIVGTSTLGQIGNIINGLNSIGNGASLLEKLGVSASNTSVNKGTGMQALANGVRTAGTSVSAVEYVGSTDAEAYAESAINSAYDEAQSDLDQQLEEYEDPVIKYLEETVNFSTKMGDIYATQVEFGKLLSNSSYVESLMNSTTVAAVAETVDTAVVSDVVDLAEEATGTSATTIEGSTSLLQYLDNMEFNTGFKILVDDVAAILNKMGTTTSSAAPTSTSSLTGFTL